MDESESKVKARASGLNFDTVLIEPSGATFVTASWSDKAGAVRCINEALDAAREEGRGEAIKAIGGDISPAQRAEWDRMVAMRDGHRDGNVKLQARLGDSASTIAQLTSENEALRAACARALPFIEGLEDKGPRDESWQSEELISVIARFRDAAAVRDAELERLHHASRTRADYDLRCEDCGGSHYLDCSIPSDVWNRVCENRDGALPGADGIGMKAVTLLCAMCLDDRLVKAGIACDVAEFYFVGKALRSRMYAESSGDVAKAERERDDLVAECVKAFGWKDESYLHALLHVHHAVSNIEADVTCLEVELGALRVACKSWVDYFDQLESSAESGDPMVTIRNQVHGARIAKTREALALSDDRPLGRDARMCAEEERGGS